MDDGNIILENWKLQLNIFTECLEKCGQRPTKNPVHDLRVSIKKLRSYSRLTQYITGQDWKRSFTETTYLFKSAGKLRDIDMTLTLYKKILKKEQTNLDSYKDFLVNKHSYLFKWLTGVVKNYKGTEIPLLTPQLETGLSAFSNAMLIEKIIEASEKKTNKATDLAEHFKKNVHEIRKLMKDVYYWIKICPDKTVVKFINMKQLDKMLNYLGSWQDLFITNKNLSYFKKKYVKPGSEEAEFISLFKDSIEQEQEELLINAKESFKAAIPVAYL